MHHLLFHCLISLKHAGHERDQKHHLSFIAMFFYKYKHMVKPINVAILETIIVLK